MESKRYDIFYLLGGGIGNVIQALYSVEYCLRLGLKVGFFLENIPESFIEYLNRCYPGIIELDQNGITANILIHSWLIKTEVKVISKNYFYVNPDYKSTKLRSEDEHYLDIVKSIFPNGEIKRTLDNLISTRPSINLENLSEKTILYPGCLWKSPVKRWPHYDKLAELIGYSKIMVVGSKDDINFSLSYIYPKWITSIIPFRVLDRISFWSLLKKLKILNPYAHLDILKEKHEFVYLEKFNWSELVYIFGKAKSFIGNDGGLSHLAGASGANGIVIFGPTSIQKSKPFNHDIKVVNLNYACQPCFYNASGVEMSTNFINCPYQVKCMLGITPKKVIEILQLNKNY